MRVTETRMLALAVQNTADARNEVAKAQQQVSTGVRVARPSDDPAEWSVGRRAAIRRAASEARGGTIATARERLELTDGSLASIGQSLSRAKQLAILGANATYGAPARAAVALEIRSMLGSSLAAANARDSDGEYILAGSQGGSAPFDAAGNYLGDTITRSIEVSEGNVLRASLPGSRLSAASGVDVLVTLADLATALENNDVPSIQASIDALDTGIEQVSAARAEAGGLGAALSAADETRMGFELTLSEVVSRSVGADLLLAASNLARSVQALEASQTVATRIVQLTGKLI